MLGRCCLTLICIVLFGAAAAPGAEGNASRRFKSTADVLKTIRDHLDALPVRERPHRRYFTLAHLHNNKGVTDEQLRVCRAAVSKLVNSLSWRSSIVVPEAVDPDGVVLAIDLRKLDWSPDDVWQEMLRQYPYGLAYDLDADPAIQKLAAELKNLTNTELPAIRADWFVAAASRPPLYHTILGLPQTAKGLESRLKVDAAANFLADRLARAGFATSGETGQARLVERHEAAYGAYWKTYDFPSSAGRGNPILFPLGPLLQNHPFPDSAFEHNGSTILFHLPNGLQAYMLVDSRGQRMDVTPIHVVGVGLRRPGAESIGNGLSCIACHHYGTKAEFKDIVREGTAVNGAPLEKVRRLHVTPQEMSRLLADDAAVFLAALDKAIGPFLHVGPNANKPIRDFPEPIGLAVRQYLLKELTLADAAAELGLHDPEQLRAAIKNNPRLKALGLLPLAAGETIKREMWESRERLVSPFQEAASELELGVPKVVQ